MGKLREIKNRRLESAMERTVAEAQLPEDADQLFRRAAPSSQDAERTGYSGYSYWGSTIRVFLKNRVAVFCLCVLAALLLFTLIQPLLPGQYPATLIVNHPITKLQMANVPPSFTTARKTVPLGTELAIASEDLEGWRAVTNVRGTIMRREKVTVTEYHGDWLRVTYKDAEGFIVNDFTTKLKLPEDPAAVPYDTQSNFVMTLYTSMDDYTNNGAELFVRSDALSFSADGKIATTVSEAKLRTLPSENAFWFGTNNVGQDLWALVWAGTRTSLFIGFVVALVGAVIGILAGVLWGYVRQLDRLMTEIYNVVDNIPSTIVLILISYVMRPGVSTLIFAMCLTEWVGMARFIRNQIVIIRDRDYNLASRCLGTSTPRIIARNLLPYLVSVIMLRMALSIPAAIGNEVFITYIGLGLPVSVPSLGNLINVGRKLVSTSQSYQLLFPTIVLSIVTISFYKIGNAFADAADPRNHVE